MSEIKVKENTEKICRIFSNKNYDIYFLTTFVGLAFIKERAFNRTVANEI